MKELSTLKKRVEKLEVRCEAMSVFITALLSTSQDHDQLVNAIQKSLELHDATVTYSASLSDQQVQEIVENVESVLLRLRQLQQPS